MNVDRPNRPPLPTGPTFVNKGADRIPKKELEVQKPGTLKVVATLLKNTTSYAPLVKMIGFGIAEGLTRVASTNIADNFSVKRAHELNKIASIFSKNYYGDAMIGVARNVSVESVIRDNSDKQATDQLFNDIERDRVANPNIPQYAQVEGVDNPKFRISDGICAGIRIDIAKRFFKGEKIETIIANNAKGAPPEAAANQALYEAIQLKTSHNTSTVFKNMFRELARVAQGKLGPGGTSASPENPGRGTAREVDFGVVAKAMIELDPYVKNGVRSGDGLVHPFIDFQKAYATQSDPNNEFLKMISEVKNDPSVYSEFAGKQQIDFDLFRTKMNDKIKNRFQIKVIESHLNQLEELTNKAGDKDVLNNYRRKLNELKENPNPELLNQLERNVKTFPVARGMKTRPVDLHPEIAYNWSVQKKQLSWVISGLQMTRYIQNPEEYKRRYDVTPPNEPPKTILDKVWSSVVDRAQAIFGKESEDRYFITAVTDPDHRHILENIFNQANHDTSIQAVLHARGLEQVSVANIIGHSSLYDNDASYISNLDRLFKAEDAEGFYSVDISTGSAGHAISLVINDNHESGYLLDPNGAQLKFNSPQEAQKLLAKMVALYPEPDSNKSGVPNHRIHIYRYQPLSK